MSRARFAPKIQFAANRRADEIDEDDDNVHAFEIDDAKIDVRSFIASAVVCLALTGVLQDVKKRCNELEYPMLEEYDFRNDTVNPNLEIDLKPTTVIRPYQETSLSKMFGNGCAAFAASVLLPPLCLNRCVAAVRVPESSYYRAGQARPWWVSRRRARSRNRASCCAPPRTPLSFCRRAPALTLPCRVSVMQWRQQFMQWSNITDRQIAVFTADQKEKVSVGHSVGPRGSHIGASLRAIAASWYRRTPWSQTHTTGLTSLRR